jgi:hypothetical protein
MSEQPYFRYRMMRPPMFGTLPNGLQYKDVSDLYGEFRIETQVEVDDEQMYRYELRLVEPEVVPEIGDTVYVRKACPDKDLRCKEAVVVAIEDKYTIYVITNSDGIEASARWFDLKIIPETTKD